MAIWSVAQSTPALAEDSVTTLVSDEQVPVEILPAAWKCRNAIPDYGYGAMPGAVAVAQKDVFDRTLRLEGSEGLRAELPDGVTCESIHEALSEVPRDLKVHRVLDRTTDLTWDHRRTVTRLQSRLTLEIPVQVAGAGLVLTGDQDWLESNVAPGADPEALPLQTSYHALLFPQAGADFIGLTCKPDYEGATRFHLSIGDLAGDPIMNGGVTNVDIAAAPFADAAACEAAKNDLMVHYQAEDPGNWGTPTTVHRKLEVEHRYILDNAAKATCQEIEIETVKLTLQGISFQGAKGFAVKTVPMAGCFPARNLHLNTD
ncbi:MAG TPA: hypothetical protein VL588_05780 [Bdellovibrionota bacterium]|nr:hypothetical protein [Bdellovibrionota bacterium]